MIVPVSFTVQRENQPEDFVVGNMSNVLPSHTYEKMRVGLVLYDTETGKTRGFSALVMFDQAAESGHEMVTLFSSQGDVPSFSSPEYLRKLRDAIEELLEAEEQS